MSSQQTAPIIQMRDIHARYGEHEALKGIDFELYPGEIHGLVGEHGAGKTTLVKLLSGAIVKTQGDLFFKGSPIEAFTPETAIQHGISMLYQHTNVLPTLNAIENMFAGRLLTTWYGTLDYKTMKSAAVDMFAKMNVTIPLDVPLRQLSTKQQQLVELAKVLLMDPTVLIFDEIARKFTPEEMEDIYHILFYLKQQEKSVIYISHDMDEIFRFADRVTILKNGCRRGTEDIRNLDRLKLLHLTYSFMLSREQLENTNRELYLLKKYNENVIKNLPVGIIILDPDNSIYLMNYVARQILTPDDAANDLQEVEALFTQAAMPHAADILESIRERKEECWEELECCGGRIIKLHTFPFEDEHYKFLGTILLLEDISKERYLNEYLTRTEKIASIAELAAGVAHEINNPLGIIQNYIMLLKRNTNDADSLIKFNKVENELERITEIIGSLLSFSRPKKRPMKALNLVAVLDDVALLLNHKLKEKQITLNWKPAPSPVPITGDENKLKQVFMNLIINSIEAVSPNGTIALSVQIFRESPDAYVDVAVADDGCGIPEDVLKRIFDPFFSTKTDPQNSGLGLSICQHIIEAHQGLITVSRNTGTTFHVRLPLSAS